jgi:deoxyribose-phosphate aldolase
MPTPKIADNNYTAEVYKIKTRIKDEAELLNFLLDTRRLLRSDSEDVEREISETREILTSLKRKLVVMELLNNLKVHYAISKFSSNQTYNYEQKQFG